MSLRWRTISVVALIVLFGWLGLSNFAGEETRKGSALLPDDGLRLGLDLLGGVHIGLGPEISAAITHELDTFGGSFESQAEEQKLVGIETRVEGDRLIVSPAGDTARDILEDIGTLSVREQGGELVATLTSEWEAEVRERAMLQSLEVLRRRVDDPQTGIPESVITRQGRDRILVQIPGVDRVPDIFRQTGFLEFKIVQDADTSVEEIEARHPEGFPAGTVIGLEKDRGSDDERVLFAYLLPELPDATGDNLTDARPQFDSLQNEWQVAFSWNSEGAARFAEITEQNLNQRLAILLDDQVYSAPVIQARISREGVITGNFTAQEATDLAVILRAGALPIPIVIEEERTIGPALGADSIRSGLLASLAGLVVIIFFVVGYYRMSGGFASIALLANLLLLLGLMSLFEGTLTLPGIAGLVLTVGMAVDANVIIFERIREELRTGKAVKAAIQTGFQKARWTILDANITTLITALVLYEFGTGPIKGFAVTLSVGILTSVFAALVITRLLYEWNPGQRNVAELSI